MKFAIVHPELITLGGAEKVVAQTFQIANKVIDTYLITNKIDFNIYPLDKNRVILFNQDFDPYSVDKNHLQIFSEKIREIAEEYKFDFFLCHNFPSYVWCFNAKIKNYSIYIHEPPRMLYHKLMHYQFDEKGFFTKIDSRRNIGEYKNLFLKKVSNKIKKILIERKEKKAVHTAKIIFSNSQYTNSFINKIYKLKSDVLYNGVDIKNIRPVKKDKREKTKNLLYLGRVTVLKNIEACLHSLKLLKTVDTANKYILHIIGSGDDLERLKKISKILKLEKDVIFYGSISDEKLSEILLKIDLCLYLPLAEPFGLVPVEMLIQGIPVLLSNFGGPYEIAKYLNYPFVVHPLDYRSIALNIMKMNKMKLEHFDFNKLLLKIKEKFNIEDFTKIYLYVHLRKLTKREKAKQIVKL